MWLVVQLAMPLCAAAQTVHGAARVSTVVDACVPIDHEQFHRVLAIELGTSIDYSPTAAQQPDGASVWIVCSEGAVQLQLEDSLTRKSMQRMVEIPDVDIATRTRLLALSVAEFVVASWVELQLAQPAISPRGAPADAEATQRANQVVRQRLPEAAGGPAPASAASPAPPRPDVAQGEDAPTKDSRAPQGTRWLLAASVEPVLFVESGGLMPQLTLRVEQRPSAHLALGLALSLGHAQWNVRWPMQVFGAALITNSSARLSLAYVAQLRSMELSVGGGARGGVVYLAGSSERANITALDLYSPWGGPAVFGSAAVLVGSFRFAVELEAGIVTLPVEATIADERDFEVVVAELSGVWASGGLQVGWLF